MAGSLNRVQLIGSLGADPEVRTFQNGGKVCNLRIATSEQWKDRNTGEKKDRTEWHSISIFSDGLIGVCEQYLRKGSKVFIEGKLQTRKWQDRNGNDRYTTEIVIQGYGGQMIMLSGKPSGDSSSGGRFNDSGGGGGYGQSSSGRSGESRYGGGHTTDPPDGSASRGSFSDDLDDDIPF